MDCRQAGETLSAYLEGALSPEEAGRVEAHLASCADCRSVRDDLVRAGQLVANLDDVEPPEWLRGRIMARVREERERKERSWWAWLSPLSGRMPAAAAAVLVAGLAVYLFQVLPEIRRSAQLPPRVLPSPAPARVQEAPPAARGAAPAPVEALPPGGSRPAPAPAPPPGASTTPAPGTAAPPPEDLTLAQKAAPAPALPAAPAPGVVSPESPVEEAEPTGAPRPETAGRLGRAEPSGPAAGLAGAGRKDEARPSEGAERQELRRFVGRGPAAAPGPGVAPPGEATGGPASPPAGAISPPPTARGAAPVPAPRVEVPAPGVASPAPLARTPVPVHEFWLHARDLGKTVDAVEALLTRLTGRATVRAFRERSAVMRTVIEPDRLTELREKLKALGQVREKPAAPEGANAPLSVRIEILAEP